ncbi:MAG: LysR substrate-binding domain-containing protein, partial [Nitrococcus sp.]|nr:LysR substrate-binding domain-containing protein [Nitrococcus sp.]
GRGVAALPNWALDEYRGQGQLAARPLGRDGLWSPLYAAVREESRDTPFIHAFLTLARAVTTECLSGIQPLEGRSVDLPSVDLP